MLESLSIRNYTLIKELEIEFSPGFSVITGETGAGKSILLGALGLILGNRADLSVLMDPNHKCVIEGQFEIGSLDLASFFTENDLDYDHQTHLRREILPSGKSRAFINDSPVKQTLLKSLGARLVDIHSQHQGLMLGRADFQLAVLDDFVNEPSVLEKYSLLFASFNQSKKQLEQLIEDQEKAKRDEDYFRFQFEELEAASLDVLEITQLEAKEKLLSHAEEVMKGLNQAKQLFSESDTTIPQQLEHLESSLGRLSAYLPKLNELGSRLKSLVIELKDISDELDSLEDEVHVSPGELLEVNERLDTIYKLQHKHAVDSVEGLIQLRDDYANKLQGYYSNEIQIKKLTAALQQIEKQLSDQGAMLSKCRRKVVPVFQNAVEGLLQQMGMKDAQFKLQFQALDDYTSSGMESLSFMFTANKGAKTEDVSRIASGGELSRLMLAIKSLISGKQMLPTVIFDEIDAGVSGEIAGKMANVIMQLANKHQVVAVTHLPQIASKASHHFKVFKSVANEQTHTLIVSLDDNARVEEIAKMLSDEKVSESALNTAKELLKINS